ncbi:MAG: leucine--tRNA ligase [Chloroflexi bacterium RBG_16_68_14]|nr:MAG: leucine--tRNA ligase [Chloroflexi bacterium RBG_16_68_14]
MARYDHRAIEAKWRERWERDGIYEIDVDGAQRPFYNLMMFPYPSAEGLHIGNVFAFTGVDIFGRYMAMRGYDVFEPFGHDAFGIHSENFALKQNVHPMTLIRNNINNFRGQMKQLGTRIAWSHEVDTTDPAYYRWTQWIFLQLFKHGLAEKRLAPVNWCPSCKTVLADEQVIDGHCERCSSEITHRSLEQWFFKITSYADRLLKNLDWIDWSEVVKTAQRNWIGRSEGLEMSFPVEGSEESISFFTTRPDTIFGVTFMVLAPEHPLVERITTSDRRAAVEDYVAQAMRKTAVDRQTMERTGVFTGAYAVNPLNGDRVPVWVADYVLITYGTGAIMAVPAHDERDFDFARQYDLPIKVVVAPPGWSGGELSGAYTGAGVLVNSDEFDGIESKAAAEAIIAKLERDGSGKHQVTYRLRDWLISRQRYWGTPIPIVHCQACGPVAVPEEQLPVVLPYVEEFRPTGTDKSPLASVESFARTTCPSCGREARRETDVCDTFLDSSWYYLRYPSTEYDDRPFDAELTKKWLPVSNYIGGKEHSVLHLLYSRFVTMALHDMGFLEFEEPFQRFRAHGMLILRGAKISKSRGNIVTPDEYFESHGADTLRAYLMFAGRYEEGGDFSDQGIEGVYRFLNRVWDLVQRYRAQEAAEGPLPIEAQRLVHRTIRKVTEDIGELKYNTAIAALMEYSNDLQHRPALNSEEVRTFLLLLAPFAPFMAEELWEQIGGAYSIHTTSWPQADEELAREQEVAVAVQIDGRTRDVIQIAAGSDEEAALQRARESARVQRHLDGKRVVRTIYVPDRLINFVTASEG